MFKTSHIIWKLTVEFIYLLWYIQIKEKVVIFKKHILLITVCFGSICFGFENINCFNKINVKSKNKIDNISSDFIDDDIYMIKDISFENGKKGKMFFIKNENIVGETYEKK